uniref:centlein-like n=1 Tax=Erigeron canadensis TaxID=72917 RepID=UPI001CB9D664|nr:centlein-like [Erigeron canadensis]
MDIPQETEEFIRENIDYSLGLPVSYRTLQLKLRSLEESHRVLRDQYLYLKSKLNEKDDVIERVRAEATMNAQAVKKFVEENQKLAIECTNLVNQVKKLEHECSLYDRDREALMDFGNEADNRAREAELRVQDLEERLGELTKELELYKKHAEGQEAGDIAKTLSTEDLLLDTLLSTLITKDDIASTAHSFLEANSGVELCKYMLEMRQSLKPSTQKILALASEIKILQKDKDHLRSNLTTAEEEVKVLFEENNVFDKENRKLMRLLQKERQLNDSGGRHNSASLKSNKRKSSPRDCSPIEKKIDFIESGSPRKALSPLRHNTPESRLLKK